MKSARFVCLFAILIGGTLLLLLAARNCCKISVTLIDTKKANRRREVALTRRLGPLFGQELLAGSIALNADETVLTRSNTF
jgi:hypothetical protein